MQCATYHIEKMDCAAEEQQIRMQLEGLQSIEHLAFDLSARQLTVYHTHSNVDAITAALERLRLGTDLVENTEGPNIASDGLPSATAPGAERRALWAALAINASFFVTEFGAGILADSMGLVADSLDMLADTVVYALSLMAVGAAASRKHQIARWSGYFQFGLAVVGLGEVIRRFLGAGGIPDVPTMIGIAALALLGNVATLLILRRVRNGEAHMEASWIFTSNDIKVNALVILSGGLVYITRSPIPDLVVGGFIFLIVARGAWQILSLAPAPKS